MRLAPGSGPTRTAHRRRHALYCGLRIGEWRRSGTCAGASSSGIPARRPTRARPERSRPAEGIRHDATRAESRLDHPVGRAGPAAGRLRLRVPAGQGRRRQRGDGRGYASAPTAPRHGAGAGASHGQPCAACAGLPTTAPHSPRRPRPRPRRPRSPRSARPPPRSPSRRSAASPSAWARRRGRSSS